MTGLGAALLAALAYGTGTVMQAIAVQRMARLPQGARLGARIRAGSLYGLGLSVDGAGFVAALLAFRSLPLFLVESAVASSVAVTALLSVLVLHIRLQRTEWLALFGVVVGLALLGSSAQAGPASAVGSRAGWLLLGATIIVCALLVWGLRDRQELRASLLLSVTAGLGFGVLGVAARVIVVPHHWWQLLGDPTLWSLLVGGGLAIIGYGYALDRGRVTTVAAVTFAVETVAPALVGLRWLGDGVRPGLWPMAILGFTVTLGGCLLLAGRAGPPAAERVPHARHAGR